MKVDEKIFGSHASKLTHRTQQMTGWVGQGSKIISSLASGEGLKETTLHFEIGTKNDLRHGLATA